MRESAGSMPSRFLLDLLGVQVVEDLAEISHVQRLAADRQWMKCSRSSRAVQPRGLPSVVIGQGAGAGRAAGQSAASHWR